MSQKLIQSQEQKAVQVQRLTQQQMLAVKMLEMPLTELEQSAFPAEQHRTGRSR